MIRKTLLLFCLFLSINSFSQQSENVIPPSPDASAFGKYGNLPISTYNGIPNINIPIYTIVDRDLKVPINLSYHASGVTVEEESGWTGLGMLLNYGGVITRTIKGGDDMQVAGDIDGYSSLYSGGSNPMYQGYPYDPTITFLGRGEVLSNDYVQGLCNHTIDSEPDIFYFNFLGQSGKFILEQGQNPADNYLVGTPVSVEKIQIRYNKSTGQWELTTSEGFTYFFGTIEVIELQRSGNDNGALSSFDRSFQFANYYDIMVGSWYIDKIVSPLGATVNYIYDTYTQPFRTSHGQIDINRIVSKYGSAKISIADYSSDIISATGNLECAAPDAFLGQGTNGTETFTSHIYLKEIQFNQGKIVVGKSARVDMFGPSNYPNVNNPFYMFGISPINAITPQGPQKLDNLTVFDNSGNQIKKFEFNYDYFNSSYNGEPCKYKRLKLLGLRECNGSSCEPYHQFFYNEASPLPSKYSKGQDFWGYPNGADYNPTFIPYATYKNPVTGKVLFTTPLVASDRQPNASYMTSGVLNKIIYPTGGSTVFQYEPHDYSIFGDGAFNYTDFENNNVITPVCGATSPNSFTGTTQSSTFSFTENQEVIIKKDIYYYNWVTASDKCAYLQPQPGSGLESGFTYVTIKKISGGSMPDITYCLVLKKVYILIENTAISLQFKYSPEINLQFTFSILFFFFFNPEMSLLIDFTNLYLIMILKTCNQINWYRFSLP